jgi:hypothetical protein
MRGIFLPLFCIVVSSVHLISLVQSSSPIPSKTFVPLFLLVCYSRASFQSLRCTVTIT